MPEVRRHNSRRTLVSRLLMKLTESISLQVRVILDVGLEKNNEEGVFTGDWGVRGAGDSEIGDLGFLVPVIVCISVRGGWRPCLSWGKSITWRGEFDTSDLDGLEVRRWGWGWEGVLQDRIRLASMFG